MLTQTQLKLNSNSTQTRSLYYLAWTSSRKRPPVIQFLGILQLSRTKNTGIWEVINYEANKWIVVLIYACVYNCFKLLTVYLSVLFLKFFGAMLTLGNLETVCVATSNAQS